MTEVSVDVVIFAFNNRNIIDVCLKSICNQSYKNFKCYIVDDHSADGTPEYVEEKYKDVIVYQKGANTGLGESRNIGLALSNAKYVAFLDSDVEIDDDWLKEGIKMMEEDPNVAICASKLFFASAKDRVNSAGGTLHPFGFGLDIGKGKEDHFFRRKEVLFACGAAMLLRRESKKWVDLMKPSFMDLKMQMLAGGPTCVVTELFSILLPLPTIAPMAPFEICLRLYTFMAPKV
jgi:glycosyltransferase involved in cell wall biosynthesis